MIRTTLTRRLLAFATVWAMSLLALPICYSTESRNAANQTISGKVTEPRLAASVDEAYAMRRLSFEENRGQSDPAVRFLSHGRGYSVFLTSTEQTIAYVANKKPGPVLRMKLIGANPQPEISGVDRLPGKANYLIGGDSRQWQTDIPTYARVRYQEAYPGVDMIFHGDQQQLEY